MAVAIAAMVSRIVVIASLALTTACAAAPETQQEEVESQTAQSQTAPAMDQASRPAPQSATVHKADACTPRPGPSRAEQVCWRWRCDGDASKVATWDGDANACQSGALDDAAADAALRRINAHRFLAGLAPFASEPAWTDAAQQCALIAHANGKLSHTPPPSWDCWSKEGAATSAGSLVANVSVAPSIAAYFEDPGNETTMVHRRWLLDETLSSVGFGTTDRYSCVVVDGHALSKPANPVAKDDVRGWAAWPPAGPVPFDVFAAEKLDTAGWTIQSTKDDLEKATVNVSRDGKIMPVTVTHLTPLEGSRSAIRFVPQGWVTEAGRSYAVSVIGSAAKIDFEVQPIDCDD